MDNRFINRYCRTYRCDTQFFVEEVKVKNKFDDGRGDYVYVNKIYNFKDGIKRIKKLAKLKNRDGELVFDFSKNKSIDEIIDYGYDEHDIFLIDEDSIDYYKE